jgi:TolB-like protein
MKKTTLLLLIITFLCVCGYIANAQKSSPKKINIAVLDFEAREGVGRGEAASLSDIFSAQLTQTGQYIIVDRNRIKAILTEQGFQQSEACSSVECVVEVGKILNVQKIFAGVIGKIGRLYTVNVQLINITTAQIELTKGRRHEGEIEDLAKTVIPEIAAEMTKALTGKDVDMDETVSSSSGFKRHEIELGLGGGSASKWNVFKKPLPEVKLQPQTVINIAYHYHFGPYFGLGLRWTRFRQTVENFPILSTTGVAATRQQKLIINNSALCLEGKLNIIRGTIEPYGALSLGYAFGNIGKSDADQGLLQLNFSGFALGFGVGAKINITNNFGTTIDLRALASSMGYDEKVPALYLFNGDRFDGGYTSVFLVLFYQFGAP